MKLLAIFFLVIFFLCEVVVLNEVFFSFFFSRFVYLLYDCILSQAFYVNTNSLVARESISKLYMARRRNSKLEKRQRNKFYAKLYKRTVSIFFPEKYFDW